MPGLTNRHDTPVQLQAYSRSLRIRVVNCYQVFDFTNNCGKVLSLMQTRRLTEVSSDICKGGYKTRKLHD